MVKGTGVHALAVLNKVLEKNTIRCSNVIGQINIQVIAIHDCTNRANGKKVTKSRKLSSGFNNCQKLRP